MIKRKDAEKKVKVTLDPILKMLEEANMSLTPEQAKEMGVQQVLQHISKAKKIVKNESNRT